MLTVSVSYRTATCFDVYTSSSGSFLFSMLKLHNEELSDLYSLPNIVRVVKSRRMRWAGHVARMGQG